MGFKFTFNILPSIWREVLWTPPRWTRPRLAGRRWSWWRRGGLSPLLRPSHHTLGETQFSRTDWHRVLPNRGNVMWCDMTLRKHEYLDRYVVLRHFTGMMVNGRLKCNLARSLSTVNISHYYSATSIYVQNGHIDIAIANWLCLVVVFLHYCTRPWARGEEPTTRWVSAAPHHSIAVSPLCPVCPVWPLCPPLCPLSPHCTVGKQSVDQLRRFSKVDINGVLVVSAVLLPVVSLVSLNTNQSAI